MIIYSIYKATCILNGKVYIGFTNNYNKRIQAHKKGYKKSNTKFYYAIQKYELHNFEWTILYQSLDGVHTKNVMENYFISEHNSYHDGYNSTTGGDGTIGLIPWNKGKIGYQIPTAETKLKMKLNNIGKHSGPRKPEHISAIKSAMAIKYCCPFCFKLSEKGNYKRWHGDNCKLFTAIKQLA